MMVGAEGFELEPFCGRPEPAGEIPSVARDPERKASDGRGGGI